MKPVNKPGRTGAESVDRRAGAEENASEARAGRTLSRAAASPGLERVRQRARQDKKAKFTALLHHVDIDVLRKSFLSLRRKAAPGVDGVTWHDYEQDLEARLVDLHARVHRGAYRAQPSRRRFIPKEDGRLRPLGVAALEDKIVQRAVVELLNAVYEPEFLGFSYGFRPGRSQHDALDALAFGITRTKVSFIVDADVRSFFDSVSHSWLVRFIEHRIGDPRIIRLIRKWLTAGVMDDGVWLATEEGTPQGSVISPTLANIYLHYCFDLWAHAWRQRHARGGVVLVRYADDSVAGFERKDDAERFLADLRQRLERFGLSLHPEKTRLIEFGRFAAVRRAKCGKQKPETFNFLGFTHICGRNRKGGFLLRRITRRDRMRARVKAVKEELRRRMHDPIPEQGRWLGQVVRGYFAYHAVPTNDSRLQEFLQLVTRLWRRTLLRRGQKDVTSWDRMTTLARAYLPWIEALHPWPQERFVAKHPRWEPGA
jgi:group II intron reverse transcriptase/maturase